MSLIGQTLSPLVTPSLREAMLFGGARGDWERIFDGAATRRHDEAVLRVLENEARREEHRREQGRRGIRCAPAPVAAAVARPHIFRDLFLSNVGGVSGASDVWLDADFVAVDGVSGKLQSWVDYVDTGHLVSQPLSALQCALPAVNAAYANALTAAFTTAEYYDSNRSAALFAWLHDGSPFDAFSVLTKQANSALWSTYTATLGALFYFNSTGFQYITGNGTGNPIGMGPGTSITNGTATFGEAYYSASDNPVATLRLRTASAATQAALNVAASATPSTTTLRMGRQSSGGTPLSGAVRAMYLFHRRFVAAERTVAQKWIQRDTGLS